MRYRNLSTIGLYLALTLCMLAGAEARPMDRLRNRSCDLMARSQDENLEDKASIEIFEDDSTGRRNILTKRVPPDEDAEDNAEKREEVAKRVETLLMWRLTEVLNLNEQQGIKVFPIIKKYEKEIRQTIAERHRVKEDLRKAIKAKANEKVDIKRLWDEFNGLNDKIYKLHNSELIELKEVLSITQVASYALFREEFEREVRELIFDARHRRDHRPPKEDERGPATNGKGPAHKG